MAQEGRGVVGRQHRRQIVDHQVRVERVGHRRQRVGRRVVMEQLGRIGRGPVGEGERDLTSEPLAVAASGEPVAGAQHRLLDRGLAGQHVGHRARRAGVEKLGHRRPAQVELDQRDPRLALPGEAEGQVQAGQRLAAARRRRGDRQRPPALRAHGLQDLGAQHVEGHMRRLGLVERHDAVAPQARGVEVEPGQAAPGRLGRLAAPAADRLAAGAHGGLEQVHALAPGITLAPVGWHVVVSFPRALRSGPGPPVIGTADVSCRSARRAAISQEASAPPSPAAGSGHG